MWNYFGNALSGASFPKSAVCKLSPPNSRGLALRLWKRKEPDPKTDGVGPDAQLIFSNNNKWYLHGTYVGLSLCTAYMTLTTAYVYHQLYNGQLPAEISPEHPVVYATLGLAFGLALLYPTRQLVKRTLFRIYYLPTTNRFTGIEYTWLMGKNGVSFGPENVELVEQSSLFREMKGNFRIKQNLYYLPLKDFKSPLYYNIMVGTVKPETMQDKK